MCTAKLSLLMTIKEMVDILEKSVGDFYASPEVKEKFRNVLENLYTESQKSLLDQGIDHQTDEEAYEFIHRLYDFWYLTCKMQHIKKVADIFDIILANHQNLSDKEIEQKLEESLSDNVLMETLAFTVDNPSYQKTVIALVKAGIAKTTK